MEGSGEERGMLGVMVGEGKDEREREMDDGWLRAEGDDCWGRRVDEVSQRGWSGKGGGGSCITRHV